MTGEQPRLDGRYELGEIIGRGGMSVVHRSYDHRTGRSVAVKIFRPGPDVTDAEQRYLREATLLAGLRDPGLVTVFDADLDGDMPYLVTELVEGPTLAQRIKQSPLTEAQMILLGTGLARTLTYVHENGVVHRDIKPANILLPTAAEDPFAAPKLVDFGIALVAEATRLTGTNLTIGTANYLSPEQLRGGPVTPAADIYSLGLVLIEALTGQPAYPGKGIDAATARLHHEPDIPACSPPVGALITELTAMEPEDRPDAEQVESRLAELTPAESLATEFVPRVPEAAAAAPVMADVGAADPDAGDFGMDEPIADSQPPRNHRIVVAAAVVVAALAVVITIASFTGRHSPGSGPQSPIPSGHSTSSTSGRPTSPHSPTPTAADQPAGPPVPFTTESSGRSSTSSPARPPTRPTTRPTSPTPTSPSPPPTSPTPPSTPISPTPPTSTPPDTTPPTTQPPTTAGD